MNLPKETTDAVVTKLRETKEAYGNPDWFAIPDVSKRKKFNLKDGSVKEYFHCMSMDFRVPMNEDLALLKKCVEEIEPLLDT